MYRYRKYSGDANFFAAGFIVHSRARDAERAAESLASAHCHAPYRRLNAYLYR